MTYEFGDKDKPTIVFIHGWMAWAMAYITLFKYLENHFHVLAIDLLGFGTSSRPEFLAANREQAEEFFIQVIEKWRIKMDISGFYMVGHSLGSYIISKYCLRYSQHVKKIALWSPLGVEPMTKNPRKYFKSFCKWFLWFKCCCWWGFKIAHKSRCNIVNLYRFCGGKMVKCWLSCQINK